VPINRQWSFGLGVNAPFGLKTEYDSDWIGRFQAIKSEVKTVNVNPAVSFKLSDSVALAAGVNWQRITATLTSRVNYAGAFAQGVGQGVAAGQIPAAVAPTLIGAAAGLESEANVDGNDSAWGWNIGALFDIDRQTRIGFQYRSKIKYDVGGSVNFNNPALGALPPTLAPVGAAVAGGVNAVLASGDVSLALEVPDSANVSLFRQIDNQWDVMADLQFTGWSSVQALTIVRSTGAVLSSTPENFRDTWRASIGANYHYSPQWMFRAGLAYDQSPVRDAQRTPRLPDNDRTWLSIGAQYRFSPQLVVDAGYTYIIVKDPNINQNEGSTAANALISGSYRNNVNIGAVQLTYTFN
jgi:long-chain fatty acid transport protein